ncbi:MAG: hypothetical protein ACI9QD_000934 [Thermoproteota archaeon]|jgi:hypothetical protein
MNKISLLLILVIIAACKNEVSDLSNNNPLQNIKPCNIGDITAPILSGSLSLADDGSKLSSATVSFNTATDNCSVSHYEVAIGTSLGSEDVLGFTNIGNVTSFKQSALSLNYAQDYFYSVKAVDSTGNASAVLNSLAWSIFSPKTLTNLVLWLDASDVSSVLDNEGDHPGEVNFNHEVKTWQDISGSSALHHFDSGAVKPSWDVSVNAIRFNGSSQFMAAADHADINLSTVGQRTFTLAVKTGVDTSTRQVLFEEGGTVRGINIYIINNELHCGFWNDTNDGDGTQPYIEVSGPISASTVNTISFVYDYSNFSGASGADGTIECILNQASLGQVNTTSRLHSHSGDIGLGAANQHTVFHDGSSSVNQDWFFDGILYEVLMYNTAHTQSEIEKLHSVIKAKWSL